MLHCQGTVKPVYNDHPGDPKFVAVDRLSLFRGSKKLLKCKNRTPKWSCYRQVVVGSGLTAFRTLLVMIRLNFFYRVDFNVSKELEWKTGKIFLLLLLLSVFRTTLQGSDLRRRTFLDICAQSIPWFVVASREEVCDTPCTPQLVLPENKNKS